MEDASSYYKFASAERADGQNEGDVRNINLKRINQDITIENQQPSPLSPRAQNQAATRPTS